MCVMGLSFRIFDILQFGMSTYPLVMTNIAMVSRWPIEIDGLPIENGDFPWRTVITRG